MIREIARYASLVENPICAEGRVSLLNDCFSLSEAGYYPPSVPLELVSQLTEETEAWVSLTMNSLMTKRLKTWGYGSVIVERGIKSLLRRLFVGSAEKLGFDERASDSAMTSMQRRAVVSAAVQGKIQGQTKLIALAFIAEVLLYSMLGALMERFDVFVQTGNMNAIPADLKSKSPNHRKTGVVRALT